MDLQKSVLFLGTKILGAAPLNAVKVTALVPLVADSWALYGLAEGLLTALGDGTLEPNEHQQLEDSKTQFLAQHPVVRQFYFQCSTIPLVAALMQVPTLGPDPPTLRPAEGDMPKKRKKKPAATPAPAPVAMPAPLPAPVAPPALPWDNP